MAAAEQGVEVIPVWNKSNRGAPDHRVRAGQHPRRGGRRGQGAGLEEAFHVDADHIGLQTVDRFMPHADFYTIDVADWIGKPAEATAVQLLSRGTRNWWEDGDSGHCASRW